MIVLYGVIFALDSGTYNGKFTGLSVDDSLNANSFVNNAKIVNSIEDTNSNEDNLGAKVIEKKEFVLKKQASLKKNSDEIVKAKIPEPNINQYVKFPWKLLLLSLVILVWGGIMVWLFFFKKKKDSNEEEEQETSSVQSVAKPVAVDLTKPIVQKPIESSNQEQQIEEVKPKIVSPKDIKVKVPAPTKSAVQPSAPESSENIPKQNLESTKPAVSGKEVKKKTEEQDDEMPW